MNSVQTLSANSAIDFIQKHKAFLLDVRSAGEYAWDHLENATNLNIRFLENHLDEIPKDQPIVVYCQHGIRSLDAAQFLMAKGYSPVYHIAGGLAQIRTLA